ncbi:MAG: MATE family efflux transporter [Lachnospiraceae bacterium]|nr:MATE family efflux transporter [Lachnospiraceae bacterium]
MRDIFKKPHNHLLFDNKALFILILPMIAELILNFSVGLADSIMVASVGESAVSGVSLVDNIFALILMLFSAMSNGGAVVAGQYIGSRNPKAAQKSATELVWSNISLGVIVMLVIYLIQGFILNVVFGSITPEVYANAKTYLNIVNLSVPFMAMYNSTAAIFRATGNTKLITLDALLMGILNIIGNAIGVFVLHAGISGVAVPTLLSRAFGGILMLVLLLRPTNPLTIDRSWKHRFDWRMVKRILTIGIPSGFENSMFQIGKIILLSVISTFGTIAITSNAVAGSIVQIQIIPGNVMSMAMMTVVAQAVGAGDYPQAKYYTRKLMSFAYLGMAVWCAIMYLLLPGILYIYGLSAETTQLTRLIVCSHMLVSIFIWPGAFALPATLRAAGDVRYPMTVSVLSMFLVRIVFSYILAVKFNMGVYGTWIGMFADWTVRAAFFLLRYLKGKWMSFRVI